MIRRAGKASLFTSLNKTEADTLNVYVYHRPPSTHLRPSQSICLRHLPAIAGLRNSMKCLLLTKRVARRIALRIELTGPVQAPVNQSDEADTSRVIRAVMQSTRGKLNPKVLRYALDASHIEEMAGAGVSGRPDNWAGEMELKSSAIRLGNQYQSCAATEPRREKWRKSNAR